MIDPPESLIKYSFEVDGGGWKNRRRELIDRSSFPAEWQK
jgi:hypothetical protein